MFRNPTTDLIVVLVIVLVIFGPKRLPGLGRSLGQGIREFKDGITNKDKDEEQPALSEGTTAPPGEATTDRERESAEVGSEPRS